jgi:cytochrome c553
VHALQAYTTGERTNAIMQGFAANLSQQDREDLAAWYASQTGLTTPRK